MHKGQLLQIIPLMNTMIINLPNASLTINIFEELNLHSVSRNYVCPAIMFCFLQVWTALSICIVMKNDVENGASAPIPAPRFERKDII